MKTLIAAALLLLTFTAHAEDDTDVCKHSADLAGTIMQARQNGQDMASVMGVVKEHFDEASRAPYVQMVIFAYDKPRFSSPEYQQNAVNDFKNSVYLGCFKVFNKR